jgi:hypothetical protein
MGKLAKGKNAKKKKKVVPQSATPIKNKSGKKKK